jgi:protein-S-isoprenylcysteine O-methyltransferase Ste14
VDWISRLARYRIAVSRLVGLLLLGLLLLSRRPIVTGEGAGLLLYWSGFVLLTVCAYGRLWSLQYLTGFKTRRVIDVGPYSVVRNPLYLFSLLGALGFALVANHVWVAVLLLAAFVLYYPFVVLSEERGLSRKLGADYGAYKERVPRFLPRWSGYREPESFEVQARRFSRAYLDAIWFPAGFLLLSLLLRLKAAGWPPDLF